MGALLPRVTTRAAGDAHEQEAPAPSEATVDAAKARPQSCLGFRVEGLWFRVEGLWLRESEATVDAAKARPQSCEAGSYLRLIDSCITLLRLKDLLGPVTRVKKKKKFRALPSGRRPGRSPARHDHFTEMCCGTEAGSYLRLWYHSA